MKAREQSQKNNHSKPKNLVEANAAFNATAGHNLLLAHIAFLATHFFFIFGIEAAFRRRIAQIRDGLRAANQIERAEPQTRLTATSKARAKSRFRSLLTNEWNEPVILAGNEYQRANRKSFLYFN